MFNRVVLVGLFLTAIIYDNVCGSYPKRILLRDVEVITLYNGQFTNARRSSPIPQLKCVGGTAGCSAFTPEVVQCHNKGSDGYDTQWECKTDMDQAYRFGKLEVSCEGYEYPDDPYILQGSCGLEYKLDLTGNGYHHSQQQYEYTGQKKTENSKLRSRDGLSFGVIIIVCIVMYGVYKWLSNNQQQNANHQAEFPRPPPPGFTAPPPPGFRPEHMPGGGSNMGGCSSSYSDSGAYQRHSASGGGTGTSGGTGTGGGFWTGAATGGILGYLFGSRNNAGYQPTYTNQRWGTGSSGSGWGSSGFGSYGSSSPGSGFGSSGFSSGSRTTSGFGGTKRR